MKAKVMTLEDTECMMKAVVKLVQAEELGKRSVQAAKDVEGVRRVWLPAAAEGGPPGHHRQARGGGPGHAKAQVHGMWMLLRTQDMPSYGRNVSLLRGAGPL